MKTKLTKEEIESIVKSKGYVDFIANMIIEQYNTRFQSITYFKENPLMYFNSWHQTKEGSDFWIEINRDPTDSEHCLTMCEKYKVIIPEEEEPKTDPIVNQVVEKFQQRSKLGIKKYGNTLYENNTDDFLNHLQEELMDAVLYIQKLKQQNGDSINNIS